MKDEIHRAPHIKQELDKEDEAYRQKAIEAARTKYGSDECVIDDGAQLSQGDEGVWVAASVWLDHSEIEPEDAEEEDPRSDD